MGALTFLSDFFYNAWTLLRNQVLRLRRPQPIYVLLDLSGPYPEHRTGRFRWIRQPQSIDELRDQLKQIAGGDAAGVVLTISSLHAGLATVQSMRAALAGLRRAGKRVVAYVPDADMRTYYLASAADTIVMPEAGALDIAGLRAEMTFFKDALDRVGVAGAFEQVGEYKGAVEPFTRGGMSEPMRESLSAVLDSMFAEVIAETAEARGIEPAVLRAAVDRAPLSAAEARSAGLVDGILFEDELPGFLQTPPRLPPSILPWTLARRRLRKPLRWRAGERAIAMIGVRGIIQMGESKNRPPLPIPFVGGAATGHATVARAFRVVERNPLFAGVILSIDSPGGSALASDLIWREVSRVNRTKPVVAYLGNVAGSGGYYIAVGAGRIVAQPTTLTGSIGVVGGKFTVRGLATRIGVNREILARGEAATMASPFTSYSAQDRRRLRRHMEETYDRFVGRVADGRRMPKEDVLAVARGRVWTGRQARERGLVDRLGDFLTAVAAVKELTGIPESRGVAVVPVRPPRAVGLGPPSVLTGFGDVWTGLSSLFEERVLALAPWEIWFR
jgi:protease IV